MATVDIKLPHHQYQVIIEPGALDRLGEIISQVVAQDKCALLADQVVYQLYGERAEASLRSSGRSVVLGRYSFTESRKTLETVSQLYQLLLDAKLERRSPVISFGGGVTGDTVGFAAATYLRGVPLVQCPTTLLAMVDASVGGKVGVNVPQGKNLVGSFFQPVVVVVDTEVLATLPARELRCGLAECVKHGVIRDRELFEWTESNLQDILALEPKVVVELVRRNVAVKAAVVEEDEKEAGVRAHLNFGHTFAHAIETTCGYGVIEHGEAVGLGMIAASKLAVDCGRCDQEVLDRLVRLLEKIGLPITAELVSNEELIEVMQLDKKVQDGKLRLVIPDSLGSVSVIDDFASDEVAEAWGIIRK